MLRWTQEGTQTRQDEKERLLEHGLKVLAGKDTAEDREALLRDRCTRLEGWAMGGWLAFIGLLTAVVVSVNEGDSALAALVVFAGLCLIGTCIWFFKARHNT